MLLGILQSLPTIYSPSSGYSRAPQQALVAAPSASQHHFLPNYMYIVQYTILGITSSLKVHDKALVGRLADYLQAFRNCQDKDYFDDSC